MYAIIGLVILYFIIKWICKALLEFTKGAIKILAILAIIAAVIMGAFIAHPIIGIIVIAIGYLYYKHNRY